LGDRHYLVALQNNSEMRDQGMVLSYGLAGFSGGRLRFDRTGSINELTLSRPAPTPIPPGTDAVFGFIHPTTLWQSVNATADSAWSGRAMADMAAQATGKPVEGVVAMDAVALARIVAIVAPLQAPEIAEPITGDNLPRILLHDLYEGLLPDERSPAKLARQAEVARAAIERMTSGGHDVVALGRALGEAAAGGHLRLWSATPVEEGVFEAVGLGGGPALRRPDRTFHAAVEARGVSKLDYYVRVELPSGSPSATTAAPWSSTP
jgi:hypothetical protein